MGHAKGYLRVLLHPQQALRLSHIPLLRFEVARRERVLVEPLRQRLGGPAADASSGDAG
jgi:hypothetical protein